MIIKHNQFVFNQIKNNVIGIKINVNKLLIYLILLVR
jgi:hypothetical protein